MKRTTANANERKEGHKGEDADSGDDKEDELVRDFDQDVVRTGDKSPANEHDNKLTDGNRSEDFVLDVDELGDDKLLRHS